MHIQPLAFQLHKKIRQALNPGGHYVLAVSGGADSMALAAACASLQAQEYASFTVCHVEHGLRGEESLRDMRLVHDFCRERQLECHAEQVDALACARRQHLSIEEAARKLRYAVLAKVLRQSCADAVVTAHNRDDQAETVLLRLLRGAGAQGLGGIRKSNNGILRPLLDFSHAQLEEYCCLQGIRYCCDSTNADIHYTRNRVRHHLLPYLEQHFNPDVRAALIRVAALLQEDDACLEQQAQTLFQRLQKKSADGSLCLDAGELRQQDISLRKRVLRAAYFAVGQQPLDYERTLALDKLCCAGTGGKVVQLPGGVTVRYYKKELIFTKI